MNAMHRTRVLLVDDDLDWLSFMSVALPRFGFSVWVADNVLEALRLLERVRPDVVVSDLAMPQQDGVDFIRALREQPNETGGRVPALALSGFSQEERGRRVLDAGFDLYAQKPIAPVKLASVLRDLILLLEDGSVGGPSAPRFEHAPL
jgi:CheY-like chemotaxis protein